MAAYFNTYTHPQLLGRRDELIQRINRDPFNDDLIEPRVLLAVMLQKGLRAEAVDLERVIQRAENVRIAQVTPRAPGVLERLPGLRIGRK